MTEEDREIVKELDGFFDALRWAKECGLEYEFMEFFLRDYGNNKDVNAAIFYANCEWDL
jgi:hypothetical protein